MKIFSPILKGTTTVAQGTTNLSGSFTGSLLGTAATASYADNFTVGGTLTAQTINVQIITSSIEFNTGSTRNGALSTNTHQFTGSVLMSGSLNVGGAATFTTATNSGITIQTPDVVTLKMLGTAGTSTNWGFARSNLASGDFGIYKSTSVGGDPISAGTAALYFLNTGAATFSSSVNVNALATSANYKLGVTGAAFISGANNKGVFITDTSTYASIVGLNSAIAAYNGIEIRGSGTDGQIFLHTTGNISMGTLTDNGERLYVSGAIRATGTITANSDLTLKKNLLRIENALEKIEQINGYTYEFKEDDSKRHAGVIAQEIQTVLPEIVNKGNDGILGVEYGNISALLIEAIKELSAKNTLLEERLTALENN